MKQIKYLSPTGIAKYRQNPEDYYMNYLAEISPEREPQTMPMSIGSAFDAYCKSYLHEALFGKGNDPKFEFDAIFEAQVSPQWRDWARLHGLYLYDIYQKSGALADLMTELTQAINVPKFEIEVMGAVHNRREPKVMEKGGVVLLGKPDAFYINKYGAHTILDWKVNGYCSRSPVSPKPGYVRLRQDLKKRGHHPDCKPMLHNGTLINGAGYLEAINVDWATQLSVYAWILGSQVGEDFIAGIDQICCAPNGSEFPTIRIAEHRTRISQQFQFESFALAQQIWEAAHSDHFFRDITKEESQLREKMLVEQLKQMSSETDQTFLEMTARAPRKF